MKKMKAIYAITALFAVMSLYLSCKADNPSLERDKVTTKLFKKQHIIRIACASSWKKNDSLQWEGIELAKEELNAAGGVSGAQIELIKIDDDLDEKRGLGLAYEIALRPDITAVIGHSNSGITLPASRVYQYYGLLMFSPMSTVRKLTTQGLSLVFRNIPDSTAFGKAAVTLCKQKGWNRIVIYYVDTVYGEDLANAFDFSCSTEDVRVVERSSFTMLDEKHNFSNALKFWNANFDYDAIFLAGSMPQIQVIIETIRESGVKKPIVGADSFEYPSLEEWIINKNIGNIYAVSSYERNSELESFQKFHEAFVNRYDKEPDQESVQGYDALKNIAAAIETTHSVKNKEIATVLRRMVCNGVMGPYKFNARGDVMGKDIYVLDYDSIRADLAKERHAELEQTRHKAWEAVEKQAEKVYNDRLKTGDKEIEDEYVE